MEQNDLEIDKIIEKMFIYADNKDLNTNRFRNLIVNPEILRVLIHQMTGMTIPEKIETIAQVAQIYKCNSLNPCILHKRDREIIEFNHSIFDEIVSFIFGIKADFIDNEKIFSKIKPLISGYPISCRNIKSLISKIAKNFHFESFNIQKLQLCLWTLRELFKNQPCKEGEPKCFFYVYGPNSGIRMISQDMKWTLHKGMHFYINFSMEGKNEEEMSLLSISVNDDVFELGIDVENYLTIRVFSASKVNKLRKLENKKWYFLKFSYCLKTGIIRNSYELLLHIEGEPFELRDLPIPSPTMKDNIDELVIGHEFYGKINFASISRSELNFWPKGGINNWGQIEGFLAANKEQLKDIFLFYSPLISSKINENEMMYEITNKNHAEILENTATHNNPFDEVDINYYGGIYTLLPFFYILRFYKYNHFSTALEEMTDLIVILFEGKFKNVENEAINCQLFGILAEFINKVDERYVTEAVIEKISTLKELIEEKALLKQYLKNFLLKIRVERISNKKIVEKIHRLISSFYFNNFSWALEIASLYDIIWYTIDNFEPEKKQDCCILHCWEQNSEGLEDSKIYELQEHYKIRCDYLKELIKYIIKKLCSSRKYDLLIPKFEIDENGLIPENKKDTFSIFEFLKFEQYSICLKKMLLECFQVGVEEDPQTLMRDTILLECLYGLLDEAELRDQITPIISVLGECSKILNLTNDPKNNEIINKIGRQLDKIYMKKYAAIRLRSKSEGIRIKRFQITDRKISNEFEDTLSYSSKSQTFDKEKEKEIKNKIIKFKKEKKIQISNDKELYDILMSICCTRNDSGDIVLIDDNCTKIVNPYFKISSMKFKVKLIEVVRTTVLITKGEKVPSKMEALAKFDQVYRFVLSEFILKELDPDDSSYRFQESTYIIKNFFYIVDHLVTCMKNNWDSLYLFILRMIGLLTEAKKDIHKKTERSKAEILTACKVCVRKFILRVLEHSEKSIENMGNMVFLVYLTVFNNHKELDQKEHIFDYFQSLESHFFIGPISIKNQDEHTFLEKSIFIDEKIILAYLDGFKMEEVFKKEFDGAKSRKYSMNLIQTYFEFKKEDDLQDYLFKLRKVFFSKTKFKEISTEDNKGIRNMISNFIIGNDEEKDNSSSELYVSEIIGLLLCLVIESSLKSHRFDFLSEALEKYELFIKALTLACSRDCLRKRDHALRNEKLPLRVVYYLIHFIYEMLETDCNENERSLIEGTLYSTLCFITQIMSILSDKVGNPHTIEEIITFSQVMQDVEEYNYFLFSVFKDVITVNEIRMYSTLPKEKGLEVLRHPEMRKHFKFVPTIFLEKHIQESVEIHDLNISKVEKELEEKFNENNDPRKKSGLSSVDSETNEFEEYRLDHARRLDFDYRHMMKVWRKIWKRLRLYHYYWSVSMDQKEEMELEWKKVKMLPYKHKFSKYTDLDGVRPILEVEPNEPWHVRKAQLEEEVKYRSENFMINLYKSKEKQVNLKPKSFIYKLLNKQISDFFMVQWIKHNSKRKGRIYITSEKLIFQYDSTFQKDSHMDFTSFTLAEHRPIEKVWPLVTIVNIIKRRYLMRKESLLIEFEDSSNIVFDFLNDDSDEFLEKIEQVKAQKSEMASFMKANKIAFYLKKFRKTNYQQEIEDITEEWCDGKITNFHYLMLLNKYSGRSYLDPVNYPVMPWIVANYDFKEMVYRDLSKTLGALGSQTRREFYENKVETLDPFNNVPAYQYGTHYSSPGVVFNFLIRLSPYTEASRTLQGGRFDLSDRLFSSIKVCWNSVRNEVSDVRELNPEFFYLPEFLLNIENYDFGMTQLKERIDNVKLPLWSANAYEFICIHRRALEGDEVSSSINNWIDLVFGYKQKGKIAKENLNLYYYLTYEDAIDLEKIDDPVQRTSIEAQIIHFGQTPSQLFFKAHPEKRFLRSGHPYSEPQKIKFIGLIDSQFPIVILGESEGNLAIFNDSTLLMISILPNFEIKSQTSLLRNTSKEKIYYVEDISVNNKVALFGNGKFVLVASYVNGDLVIYNLQGKKIHQKKGTVKSVIYINKKENLLICGSKNGLLEVYEIVYGDKDLVNLIKIVSEYYMFPIEHISEGAGFFSISSGNLVIINKITRGMNYVHDKVKMQGSKMIRSFESKRKVYGSFICTNPLYCVVFFNSLEFYIYSINGQFLKLRQVESLVNPIIIIDYMNRENILALQPNGLLVMKIPELETICSISVPNKEYTDMKIVKDRVYLMTNNGEILYLFNQKEVVFY